MPSETTTWCIIAIIFFITIDYLTGIIKAIMQNTLSSKKMREGLGHKFAYLLLACTAWFIDTTAMHIQLGLPISVFICTVSGICLIELTSILENIVIINPELANAKFMQVFTNNNHTENHVA